MPLLREIMPEPEDNASVSQSNASQISASQNGSCEDAAEIAAMVDRAHQIFKERRQDQFSLAVQLYQDACKAGSNRAKYNLGSLYMSGLAVPKDYRKALALFEEAASAGDFDAMFNIAYIYDRGFLGEQDMQNARLWYERAAQAGSGRAQYDMGAIYEHGRGVPIDLTLARYWYEQAVNSGVARAHDNLRSIEAIISVSATNSTSETV